MSNEKPSWTKRHELMEAVEDVTQSLLDKDKQIQFLKEQLEKLKSEDPISPLSAFKYGWRYCQIHHNGSTHMNRTACSEAWEKLQKSLKTSHTPLADYKQESTQGVALVDNKRVIVIGAVYKHYKGNRYRVIDVVDE